MNQTPEKLPSTKPAHNTGGWWLPLLLSLVILFVGIGIGSATTVLVMNSQFKRAIKEPDRGRMMLVKHMLGELRLPEEKRLEIEAVIEKHLDALDDIREEIAPRFKEVLELMEEEVAAMLTPEEAERWREEVDRLRQDGKRGLRHSPGGGPHGPGSGMGPGGGPGQGMGRGGGRHYGQDGEPAEDTPGDPPPPPEQPEQEQ